MLLKISQILQENTYVELPFNKVAGLQGRNVVKKKSPTKVFPIELANILITPVLVLWMQYIVDGSDEGLIILPSNVLTDK